MPFGCIVHAISTMLRIENGRCSVVIIRYLKHTKSSYLVHCCSCGPSFSTLYVRPMANE